MILDLGFLAFARAIPLHLHRNIRKDYLSLALLNAPTCFSHFCMYNVEIIVCQKNYMYLIYTGQIKLGIKDLSCVFLNIVICEQN